MREQDYKIDMPVGLLVGEHIKRGKTVGPIYKSSLGTKMALVEWSNGKIEKIGFTYLLTEEEANVKEAELQAAADKLLAEAAKANEAREQLEREWTETFHKVHPEIQAKLEQASNLIKEAVALSEAHGIPFRPEKAVLGFRMSYIPRSLKEKLPPTVEDGWDDDWYDFWTSLTGAHGGGEYDGWQSSQVC